MKRKELIEKLKQWDFMENSKKTFSEKYNISVKTIDRYIEKYNIPYEKRIFGVIKNRDRYGRYSTESCKHDLREYGNNDSIFNHISCNQQVSDNSLANRQLKADKAKAIRSFKEYNKKYDKYFAS